VEAEAVTDVPRTRYALSGDVHIAYQVFGEGPDLVMVPPAFTHIELLWDDPLSARMMRRMASFSRVIAIDRRGSGMSDRTSLPTLEEEGPDLLAVLDQVGSERSFLFGPGHGGVFSLFFAATYPERTSGVIAYSTAARGLRDDDYPWGSDPELVEFRAALFEHMRISQRDMAELLAPSRARDEGFARWLSRLTRSALSPKQAADFVRMTAQLDIRHVLPTINVPVLVLHRAGDRLTPVEHGRYLAEHIPGAQYVELPGDDYLIAAGDMDAALDEIEAFVTGVRGRSEFDRVLATVLFTDVVDSTSSAAELGDRRWRQVLDRHDELVSAELRRFSGRSVRSTGDGLIATFDGPARAVRCACAIRDAVKGLGIDLRAGLHTGEIEVRAGDVAGIAVHIGQRVSSLATAGEVLVSRTVTDLVAGSGLEFDDRGEHELKGVPGAWRLFAVR
jgi:class 3 adenylate cyclase